jgi:hypothetical protein
VNVVTTDFTALLALQPAVSAHALHLNAQQSLIFKQHF